MACAALKRPHNFDLLGTSSPESLSRNKRRRCGAVATSVSPSATISPFSEATPKVSQDELTKCVHDEWRRLHRRRKLMIPPSPPSSHHIQSMMARSPSHASSFWNTNETSRSSSSMSPPHGSSSPRGSMSPSGVMSPSGAMSPPRSSRDQPSLSIQQVVVLCERLWKEREEKLCEQYDQILHEKLGEQYDSFLKFTQDQIIRNYQQSSCSYVSWCSMTRLMSGTQLY